MRKIYLLLDTDANGNQRIAKVKKVVIDDEKNQISVIYDNYLRTPVGDMELKTRDQGMSFPWDHFDGLPFCDKDGNVIPERDAEGNIIMEDILDPDGNVIGSTPKPKLNEFTKWRTSLSSLENPIAMSIFRREGLDVPVDLDGAFIAG